jgi:type I restriction enzyme S subunit
MKTWKVDFLPSICKITTGRYDANHADSDGIYRFYTCANTYLRCNTKSFSGKSVIVPGNGDIGLVFYYDGEFEAYQRTYVLNEIKINEKYLYYHMCWKWRQFNNNKQYGSTVRYVRIGNFKQYKIAYPEELDEQKRIVAKIEELFSNLDATVAELQLAKEKLELYRQAVLSSEFHAGDFTNTKLGELILKPKYGSAKKCVYTCTDTSIPVYRIPNIDYATGTINHDDMKYADFQTEELEAIDLLENDILIIRSNGSSSLVGRCAIVKKCDENATFAGYLIRLRLKETNWATSQYIYYFLESHAARVYIEQTARSTSGVNNINAKEICDMLIPMYSNDVQEQIVKRIKGKLSVCDNLIRIINNSLQHAESMRQSILKQAFGGEL